MSVPVYVWVRAVGHQREALLQRIQEATGRTGRLSPRSFAEVSELTATQDVTSMAAKEKALRTALESSAPLVVRVLVFDSATEFDRWHSTPPNVRESSAANLLTILLLIGDLDPQVVGGIDAVWRVPNRIPGSEYPLDSEGQQRIVANAVAMIADLCRAVSSQTGEHRLVLDAVTRTLGSRCTLMVQVVRLQLDAMLDLVVRDLATLVSEWLLSQLRADSGAVGACAPDLPKSPQQPEGVAQLIAWVEEQVRETIFEPLDACGATELDRWHEGNATEVARQSVEDRTTQFITGFAHQAFEATTKFECALHKYVDDALAEKNGLGALRNLQIKLANLKAQSASIRLAPVDAPMGRPDESALIEARKRALTAEEMAERSGMLSMAWTFVAAGLAAVLFEPAWRLQASSGQAPWWSRAPASGHFWVTTLLAVVGLAVWAWCRNSTRVRLAETQLFLKQAKEDFTESVSRSCRASIDSGWASYQTKFQRLQQEQLAAEVSRINALIGVIESLRTRINQHGVARAAGPGQLDRNVDLTAYRHLVHQLAPDEIARPLSNEIVDKAHGEPGWRNVLALTDPGEVMRRCRQAFNGFDVPAPFSDHQFLRDQVAPLAAASLGDLLAQHVRLTPVGGTRPAQRAFFRPTALAELDGVVGDSYFKATTGLDMYVVAFWPPIAVGPT